MNGQKESKSFVFAAFCQLLRALSLDKGGTANGRPNALFVWTLRLVFASVMAWADLRPLAGAVGVSAGRRPFEALF